MALPSTLVWNVQSGGDDTNNGGGLDSAWGTPGGAGDRAFNNNPIAIDGTIITCVVQSTTTIVKMAGMTVTSGDNGNIINNVSGTATAGRYVIQGVDTLNNQYTLHAAPGTAGQTLIGKLGGAMATPGGANTVAAGGNTIQVKKASYTSSTEIVPVAGASAAKPTVLTGYNTTYGDLDSVADFSNFPTLTTATSGLNLVNCTNANVVIQNLIIDAANTTSSRCIRNSGVSGITVRNVKGMRFTDFGFILRNSMIAERCWLTGGSGSNGAFWTDGVGITIDCVASGNSCVGFAATTGGASTLICIRPRSSGNTGATTDGFIASGGSVLVVDHGISHGNGRDGIHYSAASDCNTYVGSSFLTNNSGYGINAVSSMTGSHRAIDYNGMGGGASANTSGARNQVDAGANDQTLTVTPYVNASTGNFAPDPNGTDFATKIKAKGFAGTQPGGTTTGYLDVGAVQHQDSGGASGGLLVNRGMTGNLAA